MIHHFTATFDSYIPSSDTLLFNDILVNDQPFRDHCYVQKFASNLKQLTPGPITGTCRIVEYVAPDGATKQAISNPILDSEHSQLVTTNFPDYQAIFSNHPLVQGIQLKEHGIIHRNLAAIHGQTLDLPVKFHPNSNQPAQYQIPTGEWISAKLFSLATTTINLEVVHHDGFFYLPEDTNFTNPLRKS